MADKSLLQSEEFTKAVSKVKACAAAVEYINESGEPGIYFTPELMGLLSDQLYESADYFDLIVSESSEA